jgi:hypothetical protein
MSVADRTSALKKLSLTDAELLAVSVAATNFKTSHDANSKAYATQAMNIQNTDADLEAYKGRANAVLQQAQDVISSSVSLNGSKKLATAIENQRLGSHVYKYFFEIASDITTLSSSDNYHHQHKVALRLAAFNPAKRLPRCPGGNPPNPVVRLSATLVGSTILNTSDGTHFTMSMVGSGSYTATWTGGYTCVDPTGGGFYIQDNARFIDGLGNITNFNGVSNLFCGFPTNGPIDLSANTTSTFTDSSDNVGGTYEFDLIEVAGTVKTVWASILDYFEFAYTWSYSAGGAVIDGNGNYFYPVINWCANGTPDWNPQIVEDSSITKAGDRFFVTGNFMIRPTPDSYWIAADAPFGGGGLTIVGYPGPLMPHLCTHTGPQL